MKTNYFQGILMLGLLVLFFLVGTVFGLAQDIEGSKDHPLISRYPGSKISKYKMQSFDELEIPLAKAKEEPWGALGKSQRVEGKITLIWYELPENRSVLEVYRNYEQALTKAGFMKLFSCNGFQECGPLQNYFHQPFEAGTWASQERQLSAKLARPEGDIYVALRVEEGGAILFVAETKSMEKDMIKVDAKYLQEELARTGHVGVYGIYFDTGKWDVKPESDPALKEVQRLMSMNPALKLYVVGHTDSVGAFESNMDLSRKRAAAVVDVLVKKYGVGPARLRPDGVGPLSPVTSNQTEQGRGKNRRVELVQQ